MNDDTKKRMKQMLTHTKKDSTILVGEGKIIQFARTPEKFIDEVEHMSDEELRGRTRSIIGMIHGVCCFGINDLEQEAILTNEMADRGFEEEVEQYYEKTEKVNENGV